MIFLNTIISFVRYFILNDFYQTYKIFIILTITDMEFRKLLIDLNENVWKCKEIGIYNNSKCKKVDKNC